MIFINGNQILFHIREVFYLKCSANKCNVKCNVVQPSPQTINIINSGHFLKHFVLLATFHKDFSRTHSVIVLFIKQ